MTADDTLIRTRRVAQAILAAALLLAILVAGIAAIRTTADAAPAAVRTLPPVAATRLAPSTIVVAAPTAAPTDTAAPAAGVTGTTALPALPIAASAAAAIVAGEPAGIVPARPFAFGRATALDRARALECLTTTIYYEAATEPDAGQRAVAQVILNRARHPAFPASVCGVVYQGSERAGCQFSFACDGAMARLPARAAWARAARAAAAALAGYVYAPVGLATHYHTYAVTPAWNRGLVMTDVVGAHFFHRWKGYWGTAAAFRQPYGAHEPVPGPHPRAVPADAAALSVAAAVAPPPLPTAPPPVTAAAQIQPAWRASGLPLTPKPRPTATPSGTDESQILPRWKDSGKPIEP